jgi:tetrapyrrole methylase family protein/MazG family protein
MTEEKKGFDRLVEIMRSLRGPGGCPWDAEQTHESLERYLVEETYEVIEAIDKNDPELLREELGDLMLQPVFHAVIAEEKGEFTLAEVISTICDKLVRRHPHVFAGQVVKTASEQVVNWELIKKKEHGEGRKSALSGVPPHLPALLKAQKITEKAARVGFDWDHADQVFAKVREELQELEVAMAAGNVSRMEAELGDLLFAITNLGRFLSINPEEALRKTIERFVRRFAHIEDTMRARGVQINEATRDEMEVLWEEAKAFERNHVK